VPVGKVSFDKDKLCENILALLETVNKLKPVSSKGTVFQEYCAFLNHGAWY